MTRCALASHSLIDRASTLVDAINALGGNFAKTLSVSDKLAEENRQRYAAWSSNPTEDQASPAAWAYRGEAFAGLSVERLDAASLEFAQEHLFIMSGLYGLLRPQDQIMPYRLEMSTRLSGAWGKNLYEFWGSSLADHIGALKPSFILNCASDEYARAIQKYLPEGVTVVTPRFLHGSRSKMAFAKYTRGLMSRWAIEQRIASPEDVRAFDLEGYTYDASLSELGRPVFIAPKDFSLKGRWTKL